MAANLATFFLAALSMSAQVVAADLYYYDGGVKRALIVDPAVGTEASKLAGKSAGETRPVSNAPAGSPVFRTGTTGVAMALPGGVILTPKSGTNEAKLIESLRAKGLDIERPIGGTGAYLLRSKEGMAALELANQLHESGEFESVSPNWWRERQKK